MKRYLQVAVYNHLLSDYRCAFQFNAKIVRTGVNRPS